MYFQSINQYAKESVSRNHLLRPAQKKERALRTLGGRPPLHWGRGLPGSGPRSQYSPISFHQAMPIVNHTTVLIVQMMKPFLHHSPWLT